MFYTVHMELIGGGIMCEGLLISTDFHLGGYKSKETLSELTYKIFPVMKSKNRSSFVCSFKSWMNSLTIKYKRFHIVVERIHRIIETVCQLRYSYCCCFRGLWNLVVIFFFRINIFFLKFNGSFKKFFTRKTQSFISLLWGHRSL